MMLRACLGFTDYGFQDLNLHGLEICCAVQNTKSQAIPTKLGFTHEGCFRQCEKLHHGWVDQFVYSMLANEWNNKMKTE